MLPAMKITEPYSPSARANASAKPVSSAGMSTGQDHQAEGLPAAGAQRGGGFFQLAVQVFQHRLHRAHHERQADEHQRHPHAQRREGDLEGQPAADPAVPAQMAVSAMPATAVGSANGRSTSASMPLAGKVVAHQHPGHDEPEPAFSRAAVNEAPKVSRYDASTRGVADGVDEQRMSVKVFVNGADSGISTIRLQVQQREAQRQVEARQHAVIARRRRKAAWRASGRLSTCV